MSTNMPQACHSERSEESAHHNLESEHVNEDRNTNY